MTTSALHWQAYNGNKRHLQMLLDIPLPGSKSLGRLLGEGAGMTVAGLRLLCCAGRIGDFSPMAH